MIPPFLLFIEVKMANRFIQVEQDNEFDKMVNHILETENHWDPDTRTWHCNKVEDGIHYTQTFSFDEDNRRICKELRDHDRLHSKFEKKEDSILGNMAIFGVPAHIDDWVLSHDPSLPANIRDEHMPTVKRLYMKYAPQYLTSIGNIEKERIYSFAKKQKAI